MIRKLAARALDFLADRIDDAVPAEVLQAFLTAELTHRIEFGDLAGEPIVQQAMVHAIQAGLVEAQTNAKAASLRSALPSQEACTRWIADLEGDRIVRWKGVHAGTSAMVLAMYMDGSIALDEWLETLLRHVEVRRKQALGRLPDGKPEGQLLERSQMAYLFSRVAVDRTDMRYLNAALKLNDWSFRDARRRASRPEADWYLLALAGVEAAFTRFAR